MKKPHFLTVLFWVFWFAMGVLLVALIMRWLEPSWEPLDGYGTPALVNASTLDEDGYALIQLRRCNAHKDAVHVASVQTFQYINGFAFSIQAGGALLLLPNGCSVLTTRYDLGERVFPGEWRIISVDTALGPHGERQSVAWSSPSFTVMASPTPEVGDEPE